MYKYVSISCMLTQLHSTFEHSKFVVVLGDDINVVAGVKSRSVKPILFPLLYIKATDLDWHYTGQTCQKMLFITATEYVWND